MDLYYKNETLYVDVTNDITIETISVMERRIFRIIDDYGVNSIVISILGNSNKGLLNLFKKNYYHHYKGFLLIK